MAPPRPQPALVSRLGLRVLFVSLVAVILLPASTWAQAQRPSIIGSGTQERVDAPADRYDAKVTRRLKRGAVLEVPSDQLEALTAEGDDIDPNQPLRANMAVTLATTGAD